MNNQSQEDPMLIDISISYLERHQFILQSELNEVYAAIECLNALSARAINDEIIEIDRVRLSNQISYLRNHADWINNRLAFLAKSVQKAIQISEATKESLSPIVQQQGVAE